MKRDEFRRRIVRRGHLLVASLAALAGCKEEYALEYGVEIAERSFQGHVVDGSTGDPIPDIELSFGGSTAASDEQGAWTITGEVPASCYDECTITATDVDGDENGAYHEHSVQVGDEDQVDRDGTDVVIELDPVEDTGG